MTIEKRLLEWLKREKFWQDREAKLCPIKSRQLWAHFKGASWAYARTIKRLKEEISASKKRTSSRV